MTDEKLIKCYKLLSIVGAILIIALVVFFIFWASGKLFDTNRPGKPDSSKEEIKVIVKDSIETGKWKDRALSAEKKLADYMAQNKRRQSSINKIKQQNEESKFKAVNSSDSIAYAIFDSLVRTSRYYKKGDTIIH